jgi:hypothetical protein
MLECDPNVSNISGPYRNNIESLRSIFVGGRAEIKDSASIEIPPQMGRSFEQQLRRGSVAFEKTPYCLIVLEYIDPLQFSQSGFMIGLKLSHLLFNLLLNSLGVLLIDPRFRLEGPGRNDILNELIEHVRRQRGPVVS